MIMWVSNWSRISYISYTWALPAVTWHSRQPPSPKMLNYIRTFIYLDVLSTSTDAQRTGCINCTVQIDCRIQPTTNSCDPRHLWSRKKTFTFNPQYESNAGTIDRMITIFKCHDIYMVLQALWYFINKCNGHRSVRAVSITSLPWPQEVH